MQLSEGFNIWNSSDTEETISDGSDHSVVYCGLQFKAISNQYQESAIVSAILLLYCMISANMTLTDHFSDQIKVVFSILWSPTVIAT